MALGLIDQGRRGSNGLLVLDCLEDILESVQRSTLFFIVSTLFFIVSSLYNCPDFENGQ